MLQECTILKIAEVFFYEPTKPHYLLEISKKSKIAHTSVKQCLHQLKKQSLIRESIEKRGKRSYPIYHADTNSPHYKKYKQINNVLKLEESGLINYLKDKCMPKVIILFGSYSRGEDLEESDIDLFIESKKEELELKKFERQLHRKIQLHYKENFHDYPRELKNNIINGTILSGYLEVFK